MKQIIKYSSEHQGQFPGYKRDSYNLIKCLRELYYPKSTNL